MPRWCTRRRRLRTSWPKTELKSRSSICARSARWTARPSHRQSRRPTKSSCCMKTLAPAAWPANWRRSSTRKPLTILTGPSCALPRSIPRCRFHRRSSTSSCLKWKMWCEKRASCTPTSSRPTHHRQFHVAGHSRLVAMPDGLRRALVISRLGPEDIGHKSLRIAIVEREPAGLHLHHDAVAGQKNVVGCRQLEAIEQGRIGFDRLRRLHAFAIAPAENVHGYRELVTAHVRLSCDFIRIHINHLYHPVSVSACGGGHQVHHRLAA